MAELRFCFKGNRNYVHGTSIVDEVLKCFSEYHINDIDIKFSGIAKSNLLLTDTDDNNEAKVSIRFNFNGEEKYWFLKENNEPIDCRNDYDEGKIINNCKLDIEKQEISLLGSTGYSACENYVAMNKFLLQKLFPDEKGKWFFTRLEQDNIIDSDSKFTLRLIKNLNFRLTKTDVIENGNIIASIYFTLVRC